MSATIAGGDIMAAVTGGVFSLTTTLPDYEAGEVLEESPASVLASYIVGTGKMSVPSSGDAWPLYISSLPDGDNVKDNAGAIYDTTPLKDGRLMDGPIIQHYGVQLTVRSADYDDGWDKISDIAAMMDGVVNEMVTRTSVDYLLQNVTRAGINALGLESGTTKRRYIFTVNFLLTLSEV